MSLLHAVPHVRVMALSSVLGAGGGRIPLVLAEVVSQLSKYPFRDEAPLLLLIEKPPTFGRSLHFCLEVYQVYIYIFCFARLIPFLFTFVATTLNGNPLVYLEGGPILGGANMQVGLPCVGSYNML